MKSQFLLIVMCVAMLTRIDPADATVQVQLTSSGWLAQLEAAMTIALEFVNALDIFKKWADSDKGSAMITIENFTNKSHLGHGKFHRVQGDINSTPIDIFGGTKSGLFAKQSDLFGQSEGLAGWDLPNTDMKVVLYWRVPRKHLFTEQKPNRLGVGFVNSSDPYWLRDMATSASDLSLPSIGMQDYYNDLETLQCCHGDLCIQGIMTSSNHCNVKIRFFPKSAADLFKHNMAYNDQHYLDQVLDVTNTCTSSSSAGSLSYDLEMALLTTVVLLVVRFVF